MERWWKNCAFHTAGPISASIERHYQSSIRCRNVLYLNVTHYQMTQRGEPMLQGSAGSFAFAWSLLKIFYVCSLTKPVRKTCEICSNIFASNALTLVPQPRWTRFRTLPSLYYTTVAFSTTPHNYSDSDNLQLQLGTPSRHPMLSVLTSLYSQIAQLLFVCVVWFTCS